MATIYSFAGLNFNDGINYFVVAKPKTIPKISPALYKIARSPGKKKSGETVDEQTIQFDVVIVGASRVDLDAKLDTLAQALYTRQAPLVVNNDGRYYIADCADAKIAYESPIKARGTLTFLAPNPYAYSMNSSIFDTFSVTMQNVGGNNYSNVFTFPGGGNVASMPQIHIINLAAAQTWAAFSIAQTNDSQQLALAFSIAIASHDYLDIYCDPTLGVGKGYSIIQSGTTYLGFNGTFPPVEPTPTTWQVNITCVAQPVIEVQWIWTPRWLV